MPKSLLTFAIIVTAITGCTHSSPRTVEPVVRGVSAIEPDESSTASTQALGPVVARGAVPAPQFDWPVDEARMTRGFFLKDPHGHSKRPHLGIDLAAKRGTPIFAAHDGTVIYVGKEFRGFGKMIMIEGKGGFATLYAHLVRARAKEGQIVRQGDLIGDMGKSGRATGVHLHFEIRTASGPVDPLQYLPNAPQQASARSAPNP